MIVREECRVCNGDGWVVDCQPAVELDYDGNEIAGWEACQVACPSCCGAGYFEIKTDDITDIKTDDITDIKIRE